MMRTTASTRKLRQLIQQISNGELTLAPEFQRRLVWSVKHKRALIKTVLENYPFPEVYIAWGDVDTTSGKGTELLVDGQQRLTTIYQYFTGAQELSLGREILPYAGLDPSAQRGFLEYEVVVRDLGDATTQEITEVFSRINSTNYSLNTMEVNHALFQGPLESFGEEIAGHAFFEAHRVFSPGDIRRMNDVRWSLLLLLTLLGGYFDRESELESKLEEYNDEFPPARKLRDELDSVFAFIEECYFDERCRVWKKVDLFTVLVEVHKAMFRREMALDPRKCGQVLGEFYSAVDAVGPGVEGTVEQESYRKYAIQGTNDRSSRIERGRIISELLQSCCC